MITLQENETKINKNFLMFRPEFGQSVLRHRHMRLRAVQVFHGFLQKDKRENPCKSMPICGKSEVQEFWDQKKRLTFRRSGNGFRYTVIFSAWARDGCARSLSSREQDVEGESLPFARNHASAAREPCNQNREAFLF